MRRIIAISLLTLIGAIPLFAAKENDNSAHIAELQKKIEEYQAKSATVLEKITSTREEAANEAASHKRYRENHKTELARLEKEKSELNIQLTSLSSSSDSLSRTISSVQRATKEFTYKEKQFRTALLSTIENYKEEVDKVPAPVLSKESESLTFLHNELSTGAISSVEATERLWQIITTINNDRLTVDVWSAPSHWEKITGQSHYLRIGFGYIAMVNDNGSAGAVWNGSSWHEVTSPSELTALRTAVKIRNGNTLPEIIALPLTILEASEEEVSDVE